MTATTPTTPAAQIIDALTLHITFSDALKNGTKLVDAQVDTSLMQGAAQFLKAYDGDFAFLLSVRENAEREHKLTRAQARGVLNTMLAQARRNANSSAAPSNSDYTPILEAVRALAAVCDGAVDLDGVGYNGVDTGFGHAMAERESLSPRMAAASFKMLRKYSAQLRNYGIEYLDLVDSVTGKTARTLAQEAAERKAAEKAAQQAARDEAEQALSAKMVALA